MASQGKAPETAVWYFVAATHVFAGPLLFFRDADLPWLPLVSLGVGLGLFVLGVRAMRKERHRSRTKRSP